MTIGCQFSLYPMTDRFEEVILDAVADLKKDADADLRIETDDISTMLIGPADKVFSAVMHCFLKACKSAEHVALNVTFSHGCPGEPGEPCCTPAGKKHTTPAAKTIQKKQSGILVSAQFALYPLNAPTYMDTIYREIEKVKQIVTVKPKHFCTRLDGDASAVFDALQNSLSAASENVTHVVVTATVSKKGKI